MIMFSVCVCVVCVGGRFLEAMYVMKSPRP